MVSRKFESASQTYHSLRLGVKFAGTSAIFKMKRGSGRPTLLAMMGRREESVQIWQTFVYQRE